MNKYPKKPSGPTDSSVLANPSHQTQAIHGAFKTGAWNFSHHLVPPMTTSTTFRLESLKRGAQGFQNFGQNKMKEPILIYDRLDEPNTLMLEEQLCALHQGEVAIAFGSGMGAISTLMMSLVQQGQKIVAHQTLYGCTYSLLKNWLPRFGIKTEFKDLNHFAELAPTHKSDSIPSLKKYLEDPETRLIYFETLSNPQLEFINFKPLLEIVKDENKKRRDDNKILVAVDNTFATPWGCRPLELGFDFVIESLTKNISGFGTDMGGTIITSKQYEVPLRVGRKDFGAIMTAHSAWHIMVYGVATQSLRFQKQQENAMVIAGFLEAHPKIEKVLYPGLASYPYYSLTKEYLKSPEGQYSPGTMMAFRLNGDFAQTEKFVDDIAENSYAITLAVSLGLTKTLIEVPGYMTHSAMSAEDQCKSGIDPKLIRLSVGLENADDIIRDLNTALDRI
ncbi:MAG: PLP-dependent transferase [Bdellovibrionaceae bacterium]|nr:PLP-dependent transferase [Pseudobdellovibrionaceae bacterium]